VNIIHRLIGISSTLAPIFLSLSQPCQAQTPQIEGVWQITDVICDHCGVNKNIDVGNKIVLAHGLFQDGYASDCGKGASYQLTQISTDDAQARLGVPKSVYALPAGPVYLALLMCAPEFGDSAAGPDSIASMILFGHDQAIYLYYGNQDFLMKRLPIKLAN